MWWIIGGVVYLVCSSIAYGYVGEIRDEMDGLIDVFIIVCWPVVLAYHCVRYFVLFFATLGEAIRQKGGE